MNALHPLRLNPPDRGLSFAHMSGNVAFVVRSLPSSVLDGAFRVHLSPDALEKAGLKLGDLCLITGENGSSGYGIAWRAMDKMGNSPKVPPVKMTDIFRNAFGFKEGSHVTIAKSAAKIQRANVVTLTDVTPSDYGNAAELDGYGRWRNKCVCTLSDAEAIAVGMTFDVTAKKGLKKRFYVEHIQAADVQAGTTRLYYMQIRDRADHGFSHRWFAFVRRRFPSRSGKWRLESSIYYCKRRCPSRAGYDQDWWADRPDQGA